MDLITNTFVLVALVLCGCTAVHGPPLTPSPASHAADWEELHPAVADMLTHAAGVAPRARRLWPELWPRDKDFLLHAPAANQTILIDSVAPDSSYHPVTGAAVPHELQNRVFLHEGPPPASLVMGKHPTEVQSRLELVPRLSFNVDEWEQGGERARHAILRTFFSEVFHHPWSRRPEFPASSFSGYFCSIASPPCEEAMELERRLLDQARLASRSELRRRLQQYAAVAWLRAITTIPPGGDVYMIRYNGAVAAVSERAARMVATIDTSGYTAELGRALDRERLQRQPGTPMQSEEGALVGETLALLLDRLEYDWRAQIRNDSGSFLSAVAEATGIDWAQAPLIAWQAAQELGFPPPFSDSGKESNRYYGPPHEIYAKRNAYNALSKSIPLKI
jgi:hypothetical protein